jgi:hypothetical protein
VATARRGRPGYPKPAGGWVSGGGTRTNRSARSGPPPSPQTRGDRLRAWASCEAEPRSPRGGRRRCRGSAPDPAPCPAPRASGAGLLQQDARSCAGAQRNSLYSQPRESSCVRGCRERSLAGYGSSPSPPPSTPLLPGLGEDPAPKTPGPHAGTGPALRSICGREFTLRYALRSRPFPALAGPGQPPRQVAPLPARLARPCRHRQAPEPAHCSADGPR